MSGLRVSSGVHGANTSTSVGPVEVVVGAEDSVVVVFAAEVVVVCRWVLMATRRVSVFAWCDVETCRPTR
jgi:hypothetical protein